MSFGYGSRQHAIGVLIDHHLGGGVKDCFLVLDPDELRAQYVAVARASFCRFRPYSRASATSILAAALAAEPCPEQPDQVEDVRHHLELLRSRLELLLAVGGGSAAVGRGSAAGSAGSRASAQPTVHRVKITLRDTKPPIWQRPEVLSGLRLSQLHGCVQSAFGWTGGHLWAFSTPQGEFGVPNPDLGFGSASGRTIGDVAPVVGSKFRYNYDFGDDWDHEILVEDIRPAEAGVAYPRCTPGRRACPLDDCGGIWGYYELLEILADPDDPEHKERLEWLGIDSADQFDPERFILADANRALKRLTGQGLS